MTSAFCFGGDGGDRTHDLLNAIQALSQLSYAPMNNAVATVTTKIIIHDHHPKVNTFFSFSRIFCRIQKRQLKTPQ